MDVIASPAAVEFVRERGGRLFVSWKTSRCCSGATSLLHTSTQPTDGRRFERVPADGIDLYVAMPRRPERLEIDLVGRFHRRLAAFWDGCVWVI